MKEHERRDVASKLAIVSGRLGRRIRGASGGLTNSLLSALATITKEGPLRLVELARIEAVSAPSATRSVAQLEARGLVYREVDPADARAFRVSATQKGADTILLARSQRAEAVDALFDRLEPHELSAIAAALPALEKLVES